MKCQIKALVWDIGGVLLENPFIGEFWKGKEGSVELRNLFGSGKISKKEFLIRASKMLDIKEDDFIKKYKKAYFPIKKIEGAFEIYRLIKSKNYLFSDTNPIHLPFIKNKYSELFNLAEESFLSSELGFRKNEKEAYNKILSKLDFLPEEILMIDDKKEVLDLAEKFGFETHLFKNPKTLRDKLKRMAVI